MPTRNFTRNPRRALKRLPGMNFLVAIGALMAVQQMSGLAQSIDRTSKETIDSAKIRFQENTHPVVLDSQAKIIPG
ncbi:MAG: hypothetical protein ABIP52_12470 [Cyclobacteriaceae bacterium]